MTSKNPQARTKAKAMILCKEIEFNETSLMTRNFKRYNISNLLQYVR